MPDTLGHTVEPSDEHRHERGPKELWSESYYLDVVSDGGAVAAYARIGRYPNLGVTWWTAMVVGPDRPVTASVAYDLPGADGSGLVIRSRGHDMICAVEKPLQVMTLQGIAPAVSYLEPGAIYSGAPGEPTSLRLDLTWATDGRPYHYGVTTRYEVPCLVSGEIRVGGERLIVSGHGQRDHSWGVRDWWATGWCWAAARLEDGTRVHFADIRLPDQPVALGYVQPPDGRLHPIESLSVTEELGDHGFPRTATAIVQPGGIEVEIRPLAFGPLLLVAPDGRTSRFPRAAARFVAGDGRTGTGWIEWNQPQAPRETE